MTKLLQLKISFPFKHDGVELSPLTLSEISAEYLDTINDKEYVRYSGQRLFDHDRESSKIHPPSG